MGFFVCPKCKSSRKVIIDDSFESAQCYEEGCLYGGHVSEFVPEKEKTPDADDFPEVYKTNGYF